MLKSHLLFATCLLLSCGLLACYYVQSREGLFGTYELNGDHRQILLDMAANGTFTETITFKSGAVQKQKGTWKFASATSNLSFDGLWIPKEFAPDYILRADETNNDQPKYTEPGNWTLTPERHWGRVVIDVFDDVAFKKVR